MLRRIGGRQFAADTMAKYRKKPVVVEAEQFGGFYATPYPPGVEMEDNSNDPDTTKKRYQFYVIAAGRGRINLDKGDWVIADPDGRGYFPCKPDEFEDTYEPAGD